MLVSILTMAETGVVATGGGGREGDGWRGFAVDTKFFNGDVDWLGLGDKF